MSKELKEIASMIQGKGHTNGYERERGNVRALLASSRCALMLERYLFGTALGAARAVYH